MGTYDAIDVARVIINECVDNGIEITHLKLQKLLYYVQGHYLAKYGEPIFDEEIRAWRLGPVVEEVYFEYSIYLADQLDREDYTIELNSKVKLEIDKVIDFYGKYTAFELVHKTHSENPWKNIYNPYLKSNIIEKNEIEKYFKVK